MSVDSYEAVLKAAAAIPLSLYNVPGTLFSHTQLISYVTRVAKFFAEVSKDTTAKFENKAICAISFDAQLAVEDETPPHGFGSSYR